MDESVLPVRTLRNDVSAVLRRVEAGERFVVTVERRPVARLEPLERRRRFVSWPEIVEGLAARAADPGLRADLRRPRPGTVADL